MSRARRNGRASAVATATAPVRCAVYTRKSTDEGLDKDFNSLDNQREAAELYIQSQQGENWIALSGRYDDGGFSGGSTNRPALQRLIADVEAGKIDIVVVYKYDRLSRSMLDFLQLLDFFKKRGVSFVSVSQRFDTSTPVGEMTLNILLSFAQFERQIIAERTRDKMRAARRHGRWTGGQPPLGYDVAPEGGRITVNRDEAEMVVGAFKLYAETPSLIAVADELNRRGWRRKAWTTKDGRHREPKPWDKANLRSLLRNPLYIGMMTLGDETFPGEHDAIVPRALFDRVQALLDGNRVSGGGGARNDRGALLRGLLKCDACGTAMVHTHTKSRYGRTYRYYRCSSSMKRGGASCPTGSVPAVQVENFVVDRIKCIGADPVLREETFRQALAQVKAERRGLAAEAKRLDRDIAKAGDEVQKLVRALADATGAARGAVNAEVQKDQERLQTLEARRTEVAQKQQALAAQQVDEAELARALEAFDPVWDELWTTEKERVLNLLIDQVRYHGETGRLEIDFRLSGISTLAVEMNGAA